MSNLKYRPDIDGLRAVAVVPVVLFHAGLGFPGGFVGVDVFLVISGLLITTIIAPEIEYRDFSILRFYERRIRRILPALFFMLVVTTVAATALLIPVHLDEYGKSLAATALFLSNAYFYSTEGYFTEAAELKPLLHTWSLAVEEQYYIVFPPLLLLLYRMLPRIGLIGVLTFFALASFVFSIWQTDQSPQAAFYLPVARMWELLTGSLLALALMKSPTPKAGGLSHSLGAAGLLGVSIPVFLYTSNTLFPGWAAVPPVLGSAAIIYAGATGKGPVTQLLSAAPFRFIGKISYSFYLWHWPLISLTFYVNLGPLSPFQGMACVAAAFILAILSLRYVEAPFRNGRRRDTAARLFAASGVAIVATVLLGATFAKLDGLPARFASKLDALWNKEELQHPQRNCHFINQNRVEADDLCLRGAKGVAASFILVGDSHANAIGTGIFAAAEALSLAGYQFTGPGLRPLPGVFPSRNAPKDMGSATMDNITAALFAFLDRHPEVTTIIYTGFWEHQATGLSYRHKNPTVWIDADYDGSGVQYNRSAMRNGLDRLAKAFPTRRLILLDDVPTGDLLDLRTFERQTLYGNFERTVKAQGGILRIEAERQRTLYEDILTAVANEHDNIRYVPLFQSMCESEICPLFGKDGARYTDGDHISRRTSLDLAPEISEKIFIRPLP
ncbi:acyltransferase family protein [Pseudooceanicola nitratireducens]|uniref:acyltransferase family protein n=1 Tax=Pseudooceanicola nitratireducens TaxID=517719 RepID=UPI003511EC7E